MKLRSGMRRSEKAVLDLRSIETILKDASIGILSLCHDGMPYSIPVNFYYENSKIYIHSAQQGQKIEYMRENPHVCFLVVHPVQVKDPKCGGALNYESVLCSGRASFSETSPREFLVKLGRKYGDCSEVTEEDCKKTAMIHIEVDEVSAKRGY